MCVCGVVQEVGLCVSFALYLMMSLCPPAPAEIILNRFDTRLGRRMGRMFGSMFPAVPDITGRQAVTFHNQRDFIFVRRHRFICESTKVWVCVCVCVCGV
ncbi:MAG: Brix domain-containing protein [Terracidiphilus sp.]|nr:Brix domain-containing protein [Terracidiphilus sp.]